MFYFIISLMLACAFAATYVISYQSTKYLAAFPTNRNCTSIDSAYGADETLYVEAAKKDYLYVRMNSF